MTRKEALRLRAIVETAVVSLDDKVASEAPTLFPKLKEDGSLIAAGTRINWNGRIRKAAVDMWDSEQNNPDNAPALWEEIPYREGIRIIPETITATGAFAAGEPGWWGDAIYISKVDANVYNPEQYPDNWTLKSE